jgi:hypothetical protein
MEQLVCTSTHGDEAGQDMAALRRLLPVKPRHNAGLVPPAQHPGPLLQAAWLQHLQQARSEEGLLPDTSPGRRHTQAGGDYAVWTVGISQDALRVAQRWPVIPAYLHHLHLVLQRLQEYGLVLNMENMELAHQEIDFLGHHITTEGASPILKHVHCTGYTRLPSPSGQEAAPNLLWNGEFL